jgi:hypothetical protein
MTEMDPPAPAPPEPAAPEPAASPSALPPAAPQPVWQAPPPAPPARPPRPGTVTAASIILIVIGSLVSLLGLLVVLGGALIGSLGEGQNLGVDLPGVTGAVGGIVAIIGLIVVLFGVLELMSGIFALLGRAWARILAMVIAGLGALFALLGVVGSGSSDAGGQVINIVLLVAYIFVIWAMATAGRWYAER